MRVERFQLVKFILESIVSTSLLNVSPDGSGEGGISTSSMVLLTVVLTKFPILHQHPWIDKRANTFETTVLNYVSSAFKIVSLHFEQLDMHM